MQKSQVLVVLLSALIVWPLGAMAVNKQQATKLAEKGFARVTFPLEGEMEDEPLPAWSGDQKRKYEDTDCNWDDPDDCDDDGGSGGDDGGKLAMKLLLPEDHKDFALVKIKNFPEFKTETVKKCAKIFGKKVCINWPQIYKRNSELWFLARVFYPVIEGEDVVGTVDTCMDVAAVTGIIAAAALLDPSAAQAAMWGGLQGCLVTEYGKLVRLFRLDVKFEKKPGNWSKI